MGRGGRPVRWVVVAAAALAAVPATCTGQVVGPELPANDLEDSIPGGQVVSSSPALVIPHPMLAPVPKATCGPGSHPLNDPMQGRVSSADIADPEAEQGWTCNIARVGHFAIPGGFRVWRYVDHNGHVCAFYDSAANSPANTISLASGPTQGVIVLDMADPAHPVMTDRLLTPGMIKPHESLNLNERRGLLAAETGTALTTSGTFDVYDVSGDCRHPVQQSVTPIRYGHESGFASDGRTFWAAGGAGQITAFDVTNPEAPFVVWQGNMYAHGLNLSADGRTLYQTDPINGNLGILDVSEVQDRKPDPQVRQISRSTWDVVSIPQNSIPITVAGHPYLIEFDEFAFRFNPATVDDRVGAARIIDIADPAHPRIVSDLRLQVNMRDVHSQLHSDPSPLGNVTSGYAAHYCDVPTRTDPPIVACSFLNSGLRVFDIRDVAHPRETAYFVSPPKEGAAPGQEGDNAFSQPTFDVARHDLWYTDATSGFYVLHLDDAAWPAPANVPASRVCRSRRALTIHLPHRIRTASVRYAGRRARVVRRGRRLTARIDMRRLKKGTVVVRIVAGTRSGRVVHLARRFHTCQPGPA